MVAPLKETLKTPVLSAEDAAAPPERQRHGHLQLPRNLDRACPCRPVQKTEQYPGFALFWFSHLFLIFPLPRWLCVQDPRHDRDRGRSTQMTGDKPPREMACLQTLEPKVGFSEWPPALTERLRPRGQKPDGKEPALSSTAPGHRCSCCNATLHQPRPASSQQVSSFVRRFLRALGAAMLPSLPGLRAPSFPSSLDSRRPESEHPTFLVPKHLYSGKEF